MNDKSQKSNQFEQTIASFSEEIKELSRQTRQLVYEILPEVVEVVWVQQKNTGFGTGVKKKSEHFCWLMPASNHVTLGFNYGAELPDPKNILEGNGILFRHFKVKSISDLSNPDLLEILKFSITYRVPKIKN